MSRRGGPVSGGDHAWCTPGSCSRPRVRDDHPMHPLVDADGRITATGEAFVQRAGEIMDEAVTKARGEVSS